MVLPIIQPERYIREGGSEAGMEILCLTTGVRPAPAARAWGHAL